MSQLNKALWTNMTKLKLLNKDNASVRFILDKSPFDEEDNESTTEQNVYVIIGRIFPNSEIFKEYSIQIEMKLTSNYPIEPPEVRLITPIYHPNVDKNGK
jgi:ubiquitin-protein ligase